MGSTEHSEAACAPHEPACQYLQMIFAGPELPCVRPCREGWSQSASIPAPSAGSARFLLPFAAGYPASLGRYLRLVARLGLLRIPSKPPTRAVSLRDSLPRHAPKRCCVSVYPEA